MSLLQQLLNKLMAKKPTKPAPAPVLPIPAAPVITQTSNSAVRLKLPAGYGQGGVQVQQVTRGIAYGPLLQAFPGSHTDPDQTVVVPGLGTDYPGEYRLRLAATALNQVSAELVLRNPSPTPAPAPVVTAAPVATPAAPQLALADTKTGTLRLKVPAGTSISTLKVLV
jgi:hypothetical protein